MSLADILTSSAAERPDNVAIKLDDIEIPYGMLDNAAAGRSMIELMLAQGLQVFSISWRNTGEEQGHFDLDTYARGASRRATPWPRSRAGHGGHAPGRS